jgi:subtilisin family serine protease
MLFRAILLVASAFLCVLSLPIAPLYRGEEGRAIDGQFIVVFHSNITQVQKTAHVEQIRSFSDSSLLAVYDIGAFQGLAAKLSESALVKLRSSPLVAFVEQDQTVQLSETCVTQTNAIWNLDRISVSQPILDGNYYYLDTAGAGVTAYIIDTGVLTTHSEFEGRASFGANFAGGTNDDCNGHGTHVAGTVAGKTYGVAKKTTIIGVKVLGCSGSGTFAGVISGIEWATNDHTQKKTAAVANMSLGGSYSLALNNAVKASVAAGVTYAVAAGNNNGDACQISPASTAEAICVGATTLEGEQGSQVDARASFSNWGTCVTLFAPGQLIDSAWIGSNTDHRIISGTSMASPHVAGVSALFLAKNPTASPAAVKDYLTKTAEQNLIDLKCTVAGCSKSPNLFLYSGCNH